MAEKHEDAGHGALFKNDKKENRRIAIIRAMSQSTAKKLRNSQL